MNTFSTEIREVPCECGTILQYYLTRKSVKNINLRIKPDGQICVSANYYVHANFIDEFVKKNQEFIIRALKKWEERRSSEPLAPPQYVDGDRFVILGQSLFLKVLQGNAESVVIDGEFLILTVSNEKNQKHRENMISQWMKIMQMETFCPICMDIHRMFTAYGVKYPQIKIRSMKARWGSCQPKRGIITLNSKLIEMPRGCIEYVVLHEFAHFIHPNHSRSFYDFVEMMMPDWRERRERLKDS